MSEIENRHDDLLYKLRRDSVATRLDLATILTHMGLRAATTAEVDEALDAE